MENKFKAYEQKDIETMRQMWNDIVLDGVAFPGENICEKDEFEKMLKAQSNVTCILQDGRIVGYFVLHPNNIGRCSHVGNASYVIAKQYRGKKLAEPLVRQSIQKAKELGFKGLQFNAVVVGNIAAVHTYQKIGFTIVGTIPGGFRLKSGEYSDMYIMYLSLV